MKVLRKQWPQLLILAAPFCAAALFWNQLPERMPIHWNAHWQIDGYAGKIFASLFLPCLNILLAACFAVLPSIDPKIRKYDEATRASVERVARAIRLVITGFFAILQLAIVAIALNLPLSMSLLTEVLVALLIIFIGAALPKLRPNYFIGVRTPWTLESPQVWMKTHRLAGQMMIIGGLVLLACSLFVPARFYFPYVFAPVMILIFLPPVIYSYRCYKTEKRA